MNGCSTCDAQAAFFFSGAAHAYYALLGTIIVCVLVVFGYNPALASIGAALAAGVFVDLWVHQYLH